MYVRTYTFEQYTYSTYYIDTYLDRVNTVHARHTMKAKDAEDVAAMQAYATRGAVQALCVSTGAVLCASLLATRLSPAYRALSAPAKAALAGVPVIAVTTIAAEERLLAYERANHAVYDPFHKEEEARVASRPTIGGSPWKTLLADYRYHIVALAWCAGVGGTLAYSYTNPLLTATQKGFHARVYSQAVTIVAAMATAVVAPFATDSSELAKVQNDELFTRRLAYEEKKYREAHAQE